MGAGQSELLRLKPLPNCSESDFFSLSVKSPKHSLSSLRRRGFRPWSKVRREDRRGIRDLFDPPLPRIRNSYHPDMQLGEVERVRLWKTRNHHVCGVAIDRRADYMHSREVVDVELAEVGSCSTRAATMPSFLRKAQVIHAGVFRLPLAREIGSQSSGFCLRSTWTFNVP